MQPINPTPNTPQANTKTSHKNNNAFTLFGSVSDLPEDSPLSDNKNSESESRQILLANSPLPLQPTTVQKHWWTPQEDDKLKQLV